GVCVLACVLCVALLGRAAVLVERRLPVFLVGRAAIVAVLDAVRVVVELGTAVLVVEAVEILRLVRALVLGVEPAVVVVVLVGAAVLVLEAVAVFLEQRTAVVLVGDAVAVAVAAVGRGADAAEHAQLRRAHALGDAGAAADQDRERLAGAQARAAGRLDGAGVEVEALQVAAAEQLGDDVEP